MPVSTRSTVARRVPLCRFPALVLSVGLLSAGVPRAATALTLQPPRLTRAQMESGRGDGAKFRFVYGTRAVASAPRLRELAFTIAKRLFGADSSQVAADRDVTEAELARGGVFLLGGPSENDWTRRLAPSLPVQFTAAGFRWQGTPYEKPEDAIHLVYPNPLAPGRFLLLFATNSPAALARRGGFLFGDEDWRITRAGELVRSGTFAQDPARPWRYDPALDRDRETERARFSGTLAALSGRGLIVRTPAGFTPAAGMLAGGEHVLATLTAMGLPAPARSPALSLTLYRSLEQKGGMTRNTRPEHVDSAGGAHAAPAGGRETPDLWSVAAARLRQLGASGDSRFLEPAGAWLTGRLEGEPLERAVARLYFGRVLPAAPEAATRSAAWRSPLVWVPARALLARAVWECAPARRTAPLALLALLRRDPPGTLDSLCAAAAVPAARVAARYRTLADSLAHAGQRSLALHQPRPWRPGDGFERGACLAHTVSLDGGYLSESCARELRTLADAGADWISLTPFGYLPDPHAPEIWSSGQGGPDEETDEAVCEAAARAHALGQRVWLKPHLWTRGWAGQMEFGIAGWPRFFDRYREFLLHWALLAQRERIDGLFVGHELVSATARDPERWRALIGETRAVYTGTLTYGANWDEVQHIPFWDALDLIGVSFYYPLASQPTRDIATLKAGAAKALAGLQPLARKFGRPVLLSELGYAPTAAAPMRPWEEGQGPIDLETQTACYRAVVDALDPCDWVAGAFWWKWFTSRAAGGPADASFSPRGKPAEAVLREALRRWRGRPVRPAR